MYISKLLVLVCIVVFLVTGCTFFPIKVEGNYNKVPFPGHFSYTDYYQNLRFNNNKVEIYGVYGQYDYEIKNNILIINFMGDKVPFNILENGDVLENRDNPYLGRYKRSK